MSGSRRDRLRRALDGPSALILCAAATFPFVGFAARNRAQTFSMARLAVYAIMVLAVVLAVQVVLVVAVRRLDPRRTAVAWAAVVTSFFLYSAWLPSLPASDTLVVVNVAIWAIVTALVARLVYALARHRLFRQWCTWTLVLLCAISLLSAVLVRPGGDPVASVDPGLAEVSPDDLVRQPDVYFFLLDGYARNDQIQTLLGYDNSALDEDLAARGFAVTDASIASYPMTFLSMMSIFESGYPYDEPAEFAAVPAGRIDRYIQGDNSTMRRFEALGYTTVYAHGGPFAFTRCSGEHVDVCLEPDSGRGAVGDLELTLAEMTPLGPLDLLQAPRTTPTSVVGALDAADVASPRFVFAHIISPHEPYYFDEACGARDRPLQQSQVDDAGNRAAYVNEIRCLNDDLMVALDRLLAADPDAIVIVASDHGSHFATPWQSALGEWTDAQLLERFANQNALRLPEACRDDVRPDTPVVHDFAIVFACLEGRAPDLAPVRAMLWRPSAPETVEEVPLERLGR